MLFSDSVIVIVEKTTQCQCITNTCEHSTLHPRTPERQDAKGKEVWGHIRDNMRP